MCLRLKLFGAKIKDPFNEITAAFDDSLFHATGIRNGCVVHTKSFDGSIEQIEKFFTDARRNGCSNTTRLG